jgi:hypothetical protein
VVVQRRVFNTALWRYGACIPHIQKRKSQSLIGCRLRVHSDYDIDPIEGRQYAYSCVH